MLNSVLAMSGARASDAPVHHYLLRQNTSTYWMLDHRPTLMGQHPVKNTLATSPNISSGIIENMHFILSKALNPNSSQPL
jgi:hypothetical protein